MRRKTLITLLLFAVLLMMANGNMPLLKQRKRAVQSESNSQADTTRRSINKLANLVDTTKMDSIQRAIYRHNKAIDDSIQLDSLNRKKKNGIDAPVTYSGEDSLVYDAKRKVAHIYGSSAVKYENMDLTSDRIQMSLDSSLVRAVGSPDSTEKKGVKGRPLFKMAGSEYESDTIAFNFKTKKGFINNVYTQQEDGYLTSEMSKRDSSGVIYLKHGRYTTCDEEHPDFYIALSRAKVRPGKDVVFGPAYLVVADVPLPLVIPYGFFPFTKKFSSGIIMPSYGDEQDRGFYLRDGGYYFAMGDKWDLKLIGEIYTQGSWGISAASNYRKRYRYNGSFLASFQDTRTGDKGMPDYARQTSFKIQWSHRQDAKANPFSSLSASVNFATSSYERNNLTSLYNPQSLTQSTRTSSISWSTNFSSIGMSLSSTANLNQNMRDSSVAMTLPDLNVSISRFYPFRRKHMVGNQRWYEKISMSYTGHLSNSINTKEDRLMKANLLKEWRNGIQHSIPVSGSFTLLNYVNVSPSFNFTDRMYSRKVERSWDTAAQKEKNDTTYGFHNVYDWNLALSASTKLYGFFVPNKKIFGDKVMAIRHVITPSVSFSYAPDFGSARYGYYGTYQKTDAHGNVSLVEYSPYEGALYGVPGKGKSGNISWDISNNLEMKIKSDHDKDSLGYKKISLIDELGLTMSYNSAATTHKWSDLSMRIRLKWWKNYTFNMNAVFGTYAYELDANGTPYIGNHTLWGMGKFGRFQGFSQNLSFTLTPEKLRKWFGGGNSEDEEAPGRDKEGVDTDIESNIDEDMIEGQRGARKKSEGGKTATDGDGYSVCSGDFEPTRASRTD